MKSEFGTVKLNFLKRIIQNNQIINKGKKDSEIEIPAEVLIPSCFPTIYRNFQNKIKDEYTKGYIQGLEDAKKNVD